MFMVDLTVNNKRLGSIIGSSILDILSVHNVLASLAVLQKGKPHASDEVLPRAR